MEEEVLDVEFGEVERDEELGVFGREVLASEEADCEVGPRWEKGRVLVYVEILDCVLGELEFERDGRGWWWWWDVGVWDGEVGCAPYK